MRGQLARPVREGGMKKRIRSNPDTAPQADSTNGDFPARRLRAPGMRADQALN